MSMDESHRLKPMIENYDKKLFDSIYEDTKQLRKKLAFEIDSRKFGVDYNEVCSWFDVKFIYAFNKYYNEVEPGVLKGFIINSLRTFKLRIVKTSYQDKYLLHQTSDITELFNYEDLLMEEDEIPDSEKELFNRSITYLKNQLSEDAYFLLHLELYPPPYILTRQANPESKKLKKAPDELILEYLDFPINEKSLSYIKQLRDEIKATMKLAREAFQYTGLN